VPIAVGAWSVLMISWGIIAYSCLNEWKKGG